MRYLPRKASFVRPASANEKRLLLNSYMSVPDVLVTGATGNVGGACARFLLAKGATVRCLVRDADGKKAHELRELGAEISVGDFSDMTSLTKAVEGVAAAFLACSNQPEQVALEKNFISAMAAGCLGRSGKSYLVKLSTCGCPTYCSHDSAIEYGRFHAAIEAALEQTADLEPNLEWTVLQPNDFMQNHAADIFGTLPSKVLAYPRTAEQLVSGRARIVDTRDVGEIAAKLILLGDRSAHHARKYHVCGPVGWSVQELAGLYEKELGLPGSAITCVADMSESAFAEGLEQNAGFPRWLAVAVARNHIFWAEGKLDYGSSDAVVALHPTPRTMEAWVKEHAPLVSFSSQPA